MGEAGERLIASAKGAQEIVAIARGLGRSQRDLMHEQASLGNEWWLAPIRCGRRSSASEAG